MPGPDGPVVVTGAGGYLGGRVVQELGPTARALVRKPVPWLPVSAQVPCDLLGSPTELRRAFDGAAAVVHLAGHNEVVAREDPERAKTETVAMARAVGQAATDAGVPRIAYVSTVHVYGEHLKPGASVDERLDPAPTSAYAQARRDSELVLAEGGPELVVLRLTNAVGAPADPDVDRWTLVANDLARQAVLDRTMVLHSAGLQWRDFIVLADACRMVLGALDRDTPAGTYNLASGRSSTIRALAEMVQDRVDAACGWRAELVAPAPDEEPVHPYCVDTAALAAVGLRAEQPLEAGVDEIVEHCIEHRERLRTG